MQFKTFILSEIQREMPTTRKMLELVPEDKYDWKPHPKSRSIGDLASHIAQLAGFAVTMAQDETFDFSRWSDMHFKTNAELLLGFDSLLTETVNALISLSEEDFDKTWAMVSGETVVNSFQKWNAIHSVFLQHIIHHRAQLGVYLRLLDIPLPPMFGPTADSQ